MSGLNNSKQPNQRNEVRILIVDDHPLVRLSLREVIKRESDLFVCGEAEDREQALELVASAKPHLAIVDLTLKSSNGMDLIKDLRDRFPKVQILVLSMHDEALHAERAIRAGARGYITKQEATKKIMVAIRQVLSGEIYWSERAAAQVASKIARATRAATTSSVDTLADRELQVFELIGAGQSTRQIAAALHIDVSTVETYRARIKEKLNLDDSLALLQFAIRWNIANATGAE
ncbi:MAG TPA: response regulator transcription factor [Verrucomicrobiae bacterium]|jgi:DNA-binding NarL/FixJ family response regulator|nr:response regulator transcription factor [Verrucomicrobiae bacterium]